MKLSGLLFPRLAAKALAARSPVDIALFGVGVTSAAASVAFATVMFTRAGEDPFIELAAALRGEVKDESAESLDG